MPNSVLPADGCQFCLPLPKAAGPKEPRMNFNRLKYLCYEQLPGRQLSSEQTSELVHMRFAGRTWTAHGRYSDNAVLIAGRIAQLAEEGKLSLADPGMVLTSGLEESQE